MQATELSIEAVQNAAYSAHRKEVLERLAVQMEAQGLRAIVAFSAENVYYVSGHPGAFAYLMPTPAISAAVFSLGRPARPTVIVNEFEGACLDLGGPCEVRTIPIWMSIDDPFHLAPRPMHAERSNEVGFSAIAAAVRSALQETGALDGARIGVEMDAVPLVGEAALRAAFDGCEVVAATELLDEARTHKTAWEIERITRAVDITEAAIRATRDHIGVGVTEREVRKAFVSAVLSNPDADGVRLAVTSVGTYFSPTAVGRSIAAVPGDLVKLDVGADVRGYGADMARVFCVGRPSAAAARVFDALKAGHDRLLELVGPGVPIARVFDEAMQTIRAAGLESYSRGHLGHSLGLSRKVEEPPHIGPHAHGVFEPGMVVCVETPYYAYGIGALQCEDVLVITENGYRDLCRLPREIASVDSPA